MSEKNSSILSKPIRFKFAIILMLALAAFPAARECWSGDTVVVIPVGKSAIEDTGRLWGTGRPGVTVSGTWTTSPADSSIEYNYSESIATWFDAAEVCPADTWVCSLSDIEGTLNAIKPYGSRACNGTISGGTTGAWVVDSNSEWDNSGYLRAEAGTGNWLKCVSIKVWCCREK